MGINRLATRPGISDQRRQNISAKADAMTDSANARRKPPTVADVATAAGRIDGRAVRTPLIRNDLLDAAAGARVFLKPECLQLTGTFKFRGAFNAISALMERGGVEHVVATSSGNHAQGVAEAARILGIKSTIVMPADAPATKIARTRRAGAEVVFFDRATEDRDTVGDKVTAERGAAFIHPYDNADVIAGQGTCGREIAFDMVSMGLEPDSVLVPCGGGGLTAGVTLAIRDQFSQAKIFCVEPEGFDDHRRSLAGGERVANERRSGSVCDALLAPMPGELGFAINSAAGVSGLVVSDDQALDAVRFAFEELKLVLEPGGAVALAAVLTSGDRFAGQTVVCVLSGGNIDAEMFERALSTKR